MYSRTVLSLIAALALCPGQANAQSYCGGNTVPARLLTYRGGEVLVLTQWRGDFVQICNLQTEWKGVPTTVCMAWMAKIANAIAEGKKMGFYYDESRPDGALCSTMPTYSGSPSPGYIDVMP